MGTFDSVIYSGALPPHEEDVSFHAAEIVAETGLEISVINPSNGERKQMRMQAGDVLSLFYEPTDEFLEQLWNRFGVCSHCGKSLLEH